MELKEITINGCKYKVNGKTVVLDYSNREKNVALNLIKNYGLNVKLVPRVLSPQGVKTPDYIIDGEMWDLKTVNSRGKNAFYNSLRHSKKQADRFIMELDDDYDDHWLHEQVESIYKSYHFRNVKQLIIYVDGKIILDKKR